MFGHAKPPLERGNLFTILYVGYCLAYLIPLGEYYHAQMAG